MISILAALSVNANEVVYGSKHGTFEDANAILITEVAAGETIQILNVTSSANQSEFSGVSLQTQHGSGPVMGWQVWSSGEGYNRRSGMIENPNFDDSIVGPCQIFISKKENNEADFWQVSYKLTKPAAANTTTSAPILLPPTQDAAQSWFVNLQVSSDLKTWEDVQPGQFLGSDSARFFRIKTIEAE